MSDSGAAAESETTAGTDFCPCCKTMRLRISCDLHADAGGIEVGYEATTENRHIVYIGNTRVEHDRVIEVSHDDFVGQYLLDIGVGCGARIEISDADRRVNHRVHFIAAVIVAVGAAARVRRMVERTENTVWIRLRIPPLLRIVFSRADNSEIGGDIRQVDLKIDPDGVEVFLQELCRCRAQRRSGDQCAMVKGTPSRSRMPVSSFMTHPASSSRAPAASGS